MLKAKQILLVQTAAKCGKGEVKGLADIPSALLPKQGTDSYAALAEKTGNEALPAIAQLLKQRANSAFKLDSQAALRNEVVSRIESLETGTTDTWTQEDAMSYLQSAKQSRAQAAADKAK